MIKKLIIENLYGRNYNLNFNDDLTIFYGKNGSGKTTILNIIQLIFDGEIKKVCGYNFDSLLMKIIIDKKEKELKILRNKNDYNIIFDNVEFKLKKLNSNIDVVYHFNSLNENLEESSNAINLYRNDLKKIKLLSSSDEDEHKVDYIYSYLKNTLDYIYIPLNRKVKTSISSSIYSRRSVVNTSNKRNIEDSLNIAESYFTSFNSYINSKVSLINNQIRTKVFDQLSSPLLYDVNLLKLNTININVLEQAVTGIFDQKIEKNIKDLLTIFRNTQNSYKVENEKIYVKNTDAFITHTFSLAQLNKLQNVIEATQSKNLLLNNLKNTFNEVLKNINLLFKETDKKIGYDNKNERLYFSNIDSSKKLNMALLSSGEKQLVIFFIFSLIDYKSKKSSILLIDEPELSLHIEWQEKLLPAIMNNNSKKQIVIATHSPDIIGNYVNKCIEIKGV